MYTVILGYLTLYTTRMMVDFRVFVFLTWSILTDSKFTSVETNIGTIHGVQEFTDVFGKSVLISKYLGIPYAEPPVGELRFTKPVQKTVIDKPLYAVKHRDACLQYEIGLQPKGNITYSEDCLYLNIYVPVLAEDSADKMAVMIWIHGGGYVAGSADGYLGDNLAAYGGVIVITLNYRLSLWGFLFSGDGKSPENYGLWDQRMALKWVHDNIKAFGGDAERVTLFGESIGAACVMLHGLYSGNKGLVQRIIAQSGGAASWLSTETVSKRKENTVKLAQYAGCDTTSMESMLHCLKIMSGKKLLDIIDNPKNDFKILPVGFIPTVDNDFIKVSKENLFSRDSRLQEGDRDFFRSLDLMVGMNNGDGSSAVGPLYGIKDSENFFPDRTVFEKNIVPALIKRLYPGLEESILKDAIAAEYTNWQDPYDSLMIREEIMSMHADSTHTGPMHLALNFHTASTRGTYMYYFDDYTSNHLFCNISWFKKVSHGAEIPLIFGYKNSDQLEDWQFQPTSSEKEWSKRVIRLWTNFAKTGNPNLPEDDGLNWLQYSSHEQHYLSISRNMTSENVRQRLNTRRANFWAHLIPALARATDCDRCTNSEKGTCQKDEPCSP